MVILSEAFTQPFGKDVDSLLDGSRHPILRMKYVNLCPLLGIVYILLKMTNQFGNKRWLINQNYFMILKKKINEANLNKNEKRQDFGFLNNNIMSHSIDSNV